jgi:periplasmic divalent cation tolerance protein
MVEFIHVFTAVDTEETALKIADMLLSERKASCVQILGPVRSNYWWHGRIERAKEWICFIKARATDYRTIESSIKRMHGYTIPEIIAFPILHGNADYLDWLRGETARRPKSRKNRDRK